jgi:hypothetical protein
MGCSQSTILPKEELYLGKIENNINNYNYLLDQFEKENFSNINEMKSNRIKKQLDEQQEQINGDLIKVRRMIEYTKDGENKEKYEKRLSEINQKIEESYFRNTDIIKIKINSIDD